MTLRSIFQSFGRGIENIIIAMYHTIVACIKAILIAIRAIVVFIFRTGKVIYKGIIIIILTLCAAAISGWIFIYLVAKAIGLSESTEFQDIRDTFLQEVHEENRE